MYWNSSRPARRRSFTVLEVIIALAILGIGLVGLIQLFPMGLEASRRAENNTRAAILAQQILESLKADSNDLPFIEGSPQIYPIPGNGFDDDERLDLGLAQGSMLAVDRNYNGKLDVDFDGGYVDLLDNTDNNLGSDGVADPASTQEPPYNYNLRGSFLLWRYRGDYNGDGDPHYDPENYGRFGIDEELPDGKDNDGDGRIDEDCTLATNVRGIRVFPLEPGDGIDNDGDGEQGSPTIDMYLDMDDDPLTSPVFMQGLKIKDGDDNNGDGLIDEGIDEEIFNGLDDDGDGLVDEDCRMASYPLTPLRFPPVVKAVAGFAKERFEHPNERFSWQVFVGRVSDGGGDGLDNDGDGLIDEDRRDGIDNDQDGRVDEDPSPLPLPGYRKVVVRITWGGDGEDNDGDGRIDEELPDGLDDDGDGLDDDIYGSKRDTFEYFYDLTGYIQIKTQSS